MSSDETPGNAPRAPFDADRPPRGAARRGGDAESVGSILARVIRDKRPARRRRRDRIAEAWVGVAGPELALETRPATLRQGVLTVEVRASSLLHELRSFRRDELLERLLAAEPSGRVTGLRFRLGVF